MTAVEAPAPFTVTKVRPPMVARGKISQSLARTPTLGMGVQVVAPDGGETNLHSHPGVDSSWMVLDGEATFYTANDRVVGVLGKNEMIMIPAGAPYWFKATSENPLVILHVTARTPEAVGLSSSRKDFAPPIEKPRDIIPGAFFGD